MGPLQKIQKKIDFAPGAHLGGAQIWGQIGGGVKLGRGPNGFTIFGFRASARNPKIFLPPPPPRYRALYGALDGALYGALSIDRPKEAYHIWGSVDRQA